MKVIYLSQEVDLNTAFFAHLHSKAELLSCTPQQDRIESMLGSQKIDAVIGTEAQLDMMKSLIQQFPMINYALISSLGADDFHEATEGYGFFMQLPHAPQREDAEKLIQLLIRISVTSEIPTGRGWRS